MSDGVGRRRVVLFLSVCALGVSSIVTQLTLMREFLSVLAGNEMIFGIILGNWLLLAGLGAWLGRTTSRLKNPLWVLLVAQIAISVGPIASVFALRTLRNVVFIRGEAIGVTPAVLSCFVLLAPYCLITGYLLILSCRILTSDKTSAGIGRVYFLDSIGEIVGGVLFSFVLIHLLKDHFGILYVPAVLNLLLAGCVAAMLRPRIPAWALVALGAIAIGGAWSGNLDGISTQIQYAPQRVVYRGNSPYGSLVVTESSGQHTFIQNGLPLLSTHNIISAEESVHYAMAQRPKARRVLLISGGVAGSAREILKYPNAQVDYVELDPLILEVSRKYLPASLDDPRIRTFNTDGRMFVRQAAGEYDVVIVNVPDPSTSQLNRFYTVEFFGEVKRALAPRGVLCISMGQYRNYLSKELAQLIGTAHRTLETVFSESLIVPAGRTFLLASDGELTMDIAERIEAAGISNQYVNANYLTGILTADRIADVRRAISPDAPVNRDLHPVGYYYHLQYWLSRFKYQTGALEAVLLIILLIYVIRLRAVPLAIFTTGFSVASLEIVLLLGFQILQGSLYHNIGLIVTMFMLGLSLGSLAMNRMLNHWTARGLAKLEFALAIYAGLLPVMLTALAGIADPQLMSTCSQIAVPCATLILGLLAGMEFPLAGKANFSGLAPTASRLYTADLVGAALGALLVSTLLIPLIGVIGVCVVAVALKAAGGTIILLRSPK
jgi:spermidine synthase